MDGVTVLALRKPGLLGCFSSSRPPRPPAANPNRRAVVEGAPVLDDRRRLALRLFLVGLLDRARGVPVPLRLREVLVFVLVASLSLSLS